MPKVSIIVPVYNVEKYLRPCLDSILAQTFTDFEAILVDDGSKDTSGSICDEYATKDMRFKVVHKSNGGVSSAKNLGLDKACGEWIMFCDSDDLLYDNTLETFLCQINNHVDSICGSYVEIHEDDIIIKYSSSKNFETEINREEALIDFYKPVYYDLFNGYLCNRIFRAHIIKEHHLRFREDLYIKEDGLFLVEFLCMSKNRHLYISYPVYKYRQSPCGVTRTYNMYFNKKSLTNLYARCYCYKAIKQVTTNEKLLIISKNSAIAKYKQLISFMVRDRAFKIKPFIMMTLTTFKHVSPFYIIKGKLKKVLFVSHTWQA